MSLAAANRLIDETAAAGLCYLTIPLPRAELTFTSTSAAKDFCGINQFIAAGNLVSPSVHNRMMQKYLAPVFMELGYHKGLAKSNAKKHIPVWLKIHIPEISQFFSHCLLFELARQLSARIFRNQAKPDAGILFS